MGDVVPQHIFFHAPQCGSHGRNLRYDFDAIAILLDHTAETSHLTFDAGEAL